MGSRRNELPQPTTTIQQDNKSVITMQNQGAGQVKRGRYIEVKFYYVSDLIKDKLVELVYTASDDMLADGFTKGLVGRKFIEWSSHIRNDATKRLSSQSNDPNDSNKRTRKTTE
jgi:hypothetical protein